MKPIANLKRLWRNSMAIKFYNTQKIVQSSLDKYSLQEDSQFLKDIKSATKIVIISAFYNIEFFEILYKVNRKAKIEIFIPAEKGLFKAIKQQHDLTDFIKDKHDKF